MSLSRQDLKIGTASLAACILVFAAVPTFLKSFTHALDAWTVNTFRYGVAALVWAPFVWRHRRETVAGTPSLWRAALIPAAANLGAQTGWAWAPYYNDATVISFVVRSSFAFTILFSFWMLREERAVIRRPAFWMAFAGIVAGVVAMYWGGLELGNMTRIGVAILVADAALWGLYGVCVRRYLGAYTARLAFGVISLYTAGALLLVGLWLGDWSAVPHVAPAMWVHLVLSALLGIAIGHVLLYRAIGLVGPIVTEGAFSLVPFAAAFVAIWTLGEQLGALQWVGGVVLVVSSYLLVRTKAAAETGTAP